MSREIRSYDYVNHPYAAVRDALVKDPAGVLRAATNAAASRARAVAAALHVNIGPLDIGAEIAVTVGEISEQTHDAPMSRVTRIPIEWSAAQRAALFPIMNAELSVYPLTATETQLDFLGRYEPPLGIVGGALDAMVGHRIAEASVHRLIADVAKYLREHVDKVGSISTLKQLLSDVRVVTDAGWQGPGGSSRSSTAPIAPHSPRRSRTSARARGGLLRGGSRGIR